MVRLVIKSPLATWLSLATYEHSQGLNKPLFSVSAEPRSSGIAMAEWGSVGQIYMQSCLKFSFASSETWVGNLPLYQKKKKSSVFQGGHPGSARGSSLTAFSIPRDCSDPKWVVLLG